MQSAFAIRPGLIDIAASADVALVKRIAVSSAALAEIARIIVERKQQTVFILFSFTVACRSGCVVTEE